MSIQAMNLCGSRLSVFLSHPDVQRKVKVRYLKDVTKSETIYTDRQAASVDSMDHGLASCQVLGMGWLALAR